MRTTIKGLFVAALLVFGSVQTHAAGQEPVVAKKKWTVLVFINGNNNLDHYGAFNINQMEQVGSSDDMNIVVQWASYSARNTKRLLVTKDTNPNTVTSPVIETLPKTDMGDYKELIKFLEWGIQRYPAEHYFVDVWNHGNGWKRRSIDTVRNISYDDYSGHSITIPQLRMALEAAQAKAGQKIDVYGSDACLMAMAEVGTELAGAVNYMVGSQETEPGDGWPYNTWLQSWTQMGLDDVKNAGIALTNAYVDYYSDPQNNQAGTFSTIDLGALTALNASLKTFATELQPMVAAEKRNFVRAISATANFYVSEYVDLADLIEKMKTNVSAVSSLSSTQAVKENLAKAVVISKTIDMVGNGLSIWAPTTASQYNSVSTRYNELMFQQTTHWGDFLAGILR